MPMASVMVDWQAFKSVSPWSMMASRSLPFGLGTSKYDSNVCVAHCHGLLVMVAQSPGPPATLAARSVWGSQHRL